MAKNNLKKSELRRRIVADRLEMEYERRNKMDREILRILTGLPEYISSDIILTYVSYNGEADTYMFIERALNDGKRVACPLCSFEDDIPSLDFFFINSVNDLIKGYKGIPEPNKEALFKVSDEDILKAFIIVPMVGYDRSGNRLGYGMGFYDRFLSSTTHGSTAAIAYSFQECEVIPVDEHDVRPDMIITEKGIYKMIHTGR